MKLYAPWLLAAGIALCLTPSIASATETEESPIEWRDSSYDVYRNGEFVPGVQVFTTRDPSRVAILSPDLPAVIVAESESGAVRALPVEDFHPGAEGALSTDPAESPERGQMHTISGHRSTHYWLTFDDLHLLLSSHQGPMGPLDEAALWSAVPTWHRRLEGHTPDEATVQALADYDGEPIDVQIAFGTWCGDSRAQVPNLLAALHQANNPLIRTELLAIGRGFTEPADDIRTLRLTNVPTVIVRRDGQEIGRSVETPITTDLATDLLTALDGPLPPHPSRYTRGDRIASGRYVYLDEANNTLGEERFELYDDGEGGRLLHTIVERGDERTEIWHGLTKDGELDLAEVTRTTQGTHSRSRVFTSSDGTLSIHTRGADTGIVAQDLTPPPGTTLVLPAVATATPSESSHALVLPGAGEAGSALLRPLSWRAGSNAQIPTPAGQRSGRQQARQYGDDETLWLLDNELNLPLSGRMGEVEVRLVELELGQPED